MNKLYEIVHGSENSLDKDVYWVMNILPTKEDLTILNKSQDVSDVNFITITDGKVSGCIKGVIDEINNGIIDTFYLHSQEIVDCPVLYRMERDNFIKSIRILRGILLQFSKTIYRPDVQKASRSHSISKKIEQTLLLIEKIPEIEDFVRLNKTDLFKFFSFQIVQGYSLFKGYEIYTKNDAIKHFPKLKKFINREDYSHDDLKYLMSLMTEFVVFFKSFYEHSFSEDSNYATHLETGLIFDIKFEEYLVIKSFES